MRIPEGFKCDGGIRPHLVKVFQGEYDVPLKNHTPLTILDIGANVGAFSLWACDKWPGSTVHAYEPHPKTFETLSENLRLIRNGWYKLHNYAVGRPGYRHLIEGANNSGEATLWPGNDVSTNIVHPVKVIDPLEMPEADILKIDAEGSEHEILLPLITGGRKYSAIMFEYHCIEMRRVLDQLLSDYVLTGASIPTPSIGVMCYVHQDHMKRHFK